MSLLEAYLFLFTDSLVSGLVLPAKPAIVFPVMKIFGGYNLYFAGLLSVIGVTVAAFLNWLLGRALRSLKKRSHEEIQSNKTNKIFSFLEKYGYYASIFAFIPVIGPLIIVFTGIISAKLTRS